MIARPGISRVGKRPSTVIGFKYQPSKPEDIKKRAERQGGTYDSLFKSGYDTFKPHEGENCVRILPPQWDAHDHWGYTMWVHQYVGPDSVSYLCLRKMLGKPCPICDMQEEVRREGDEEMTKQLAAYERTCYCIIDRMARDDAAFLPLFYHVSWRTDKDITALTQHSRSSKILYIDQPDHGFDLTFRRTGKGEHTRYSAWAFDREPSPIADDPKIQDELLKFVYENPIPKCLQFFSYEHIEKAVAGASKPDEEEEVQEEEVTGTDVQYDEETGEILEDPVEYVDEHGNPCDAEGNPLADAVEEAVQEEDLAEEYADAQAEEYPEEAEVEEVEEVIAPQSVKRQVVRPTPKPTAKAAPVAKPVAAKPTPRVVARPAAAKPIARPATPTRTIVRPQTPQGRAPLKPRR